MEVLLSGQAGFKFQIMSGASDTPDPPDLPDLAVLGYFLWGYIKIKVYRHVLPILMT
jgi:hypothetical protein